MPPIIKDLHGRVFKNHLLLQKDLIADQTFDYLVNIFNPANWSFTVGEGLGNSATGAASAYALCGGGKNARITAGFKFLGNSNYTQGLVFRDRLLAIPTGATGNLYSGKVNLGNITWTRYINGAAVVLATAAITDPPIDGDIFRLTGSSQENSFYLLYENQARSSNTPGAAPYNLDGIDGGNPVTVTLTVNGTAQTITFASTDALILNFAAVTEAEVLAVFNSQLVGAVAHANFGATYTILAAPGVGTSSKLQVTGGNANPVLGFDGIAHSGANQSIAASDSTHPWGYCGVWSNTSKHYWRDVKVEAI